MRRRITRGAGLALFLAGLFLLLAASSFIAYAEVAKARLDRLNRRADPSVAVPTPSLGEASPVAEASSEEKKPAPSSPPKYIYIPRVVISSKVVEVGTKWEESVLVWDVADFEAGYHKGTAYPGEGNTVITGHLTSRYRGLGEVFKNLPQVLPGDEVFIYTEDRQFVYRVVETKVVKPEQIDVLEVTPDATLTLITCVPDWVYTERFIATGKLVRTSPLLGEDTTTGTAG